MGGCGNCGGCGEGGAPEIPDDLVPEDILKKTLEKMPESSQQIIRAIKKELDALVEGTPVTQRDYLYFAMALMLEEREKQDHATETAIG